MQIKVKPLCTPIRIEFYIKSIKMREKDSINYSVERRHVLAWKSLKDLM